MSGASKFLSKGGVILGIAAFSKARRIDSWERLGPALRSPVQRISRDESSKSVVELARAVMMATQGGVPVSIPQWVRACVANNELLTHVGNSVAFQWPPESDTPGPDARKGGMIALAVAICRNSDMAKAVSNLFAHPQEQSLFWDAASVAAVLAGPGVPSQIRREIKKCISIHDKTTDTQEA